MCIVSLWTEEQRKLGLWTQWGGLWQEYPGWWPHTKYQLSASPPPPALEQIPLTPGSDLTPEALSDSIYTFGKLRLIEVKRGDLFFSYRHNEAESQYRLWVLRPHQAPQLRGSGMEGNQCCSLSTKPPFQAPNCGTGSRNVRCC